MCDVIVTGRLIAHAWIVSVLLCKQKRCCAGLDGGCHHRCLQSNSYTKGWGARCHSVSSSRAPAHGPFCAGLSAGNASLHLHPEAGTPTHEHEAIDHSVQAFVRVTAAAREHFSRVGTLPVCITCAHCVHLGHWEVMCVQRVHHRHCLMSESSTLQHK